MTVARHIALVVNPYAGSGRATRLANEVSQALAQRNIPYGLFSEQWPTGFDTFTDIWIIGGDGTLNFFINQYPTIQLPLAIFRGGSGNDFHWLLYGEASLEAMLELVLHRDAQPVDAGICNGRLFINGIGIGFDGAVAASLRGKNKRMGKHTFMTAVLKKILFFREQEFTVTMDGSTIRESMLMINIMNGQRAGGGFYVSPVAVAKDGLLDVNIVRPLSLIKRLRYLPVIEKGKHLDLPYIFYKKARSVHILTGKIVPAHCDGEYFADKEFRAEILPGRFYFRY